MPENLIEDNIFKAYDIRGIYPDQINENTAFKIAVGLVKFLNPDKLVVAQDARIGSDTLKDSIITAILSNGVDVIDIGYSTTPLFYYSVNKLNAGGGIMVTASHNPPQYNGLKIVKEKAIPIGKDNGLLQIKNLSKEVPIEKVRKGKLLKKDLIEDYIKLLIEKSNLKEGEEINMKLIIDAGNGITGIILPKLLPKLLYRLKINYLPLFFEIDGRFPNHLPDISKEENLKILKQKVLEENADLGIAFDGDGDRLAILNNEGQLMRADLLAGILIKEILNRRSYWQSIFNRPKFVYDLRFSKSISEFVKENNGLAVKSKVGHTFIKEVMRKNKAIFGAELSGHFYFKENYYCESAILAMLKILKILTISKKSIDDSVASFQKYFNSGEINIEAEITQQSWETIKEKIKNTYKLAKVEEIDGILIDLWNKEGWWFNLRPSNTEPLLRLVVEAKTQYILEQKKKEIIELLKS